MAALSPILRDVDYGAGRSGVSFWCPGCEGVHAIPTAGPNSWGYNGKADRPTFTPSILVRRGHYVAGVEGCWCTFNAARIAEGNEPSGFTCGICHSFVTDGQIQFLGDCTHALAGQTVPIPEWPADAL